MPPPASPTQKRAVKTETELWLHVEKGERWGGYLESSTGNKRIKPESCFCVPGTFIFTDHCEEHTKKRNINLKIPIFRTGVHYLQKKFGRNDSKRLISESFAHISGK